jgi:hypothetical protein
MLYFENKTMLKKHLLIVVLFTIPFLVMAQEARPVIRFTPFVSQGINSEEARFIESLIQSYASEAGELVIYYDNIPPEAYLSEGGLLTGSWNKIPDYILSGSIYLERKIRIFTLEFRNTHTNEVTKTTTEHRTAGDLVLRARSLVESIIKPPVLSGAESAAANEAEREIPQIITENGIAGTWRGEPGIEIIRLQPGGRGTAFFSSGAQMNLSYVIEDNVLKIWQNSPNVERFYHSNPPEIAKLLSGRAEPMRWEFMLYSGGNRLRGTRISTETRILQDGNTELLYETVRDAALIRSYY